MRYLDYLEDRLDVKINRTVGGKEKDGTEQKTLHKLIKHTVKFPFGRGRFCTMYLNNTY